MGIRRTRTSSRRPLRVVISVVLLVDLAVLGTDGYLLSHRSTTTTVDLQDALATFRASGSTGPADRAVATAAGGAVAAVPAAAVAAPAGTPAPGTTAPAPATTGPAVAAASTTTAPAAVAPPVEGVYEYRTAGGESVSVLAAHHDYPSTTYAAVRRTGGCGWTIRAAVVQEHVDERSMCSDPTGVLQRSQSREVTFFGTTDGGTFTCTPPAVQAGPGDGAGSRSQSDCGDGKGSSARLVRTVLGRDAAVVDGVTVEVVRIRIDGTITGRIRGTSTDLLTLVAATGLPIRWTRSVDSLADAFGSTVRYQEQAQFDLVSLTPAT